MSAVPGALIVLGLLTARRRPARPHGPREYAVLLTDTAQDVEVAAARLATAITDLAIPRPGRLRRRHRGRRGHHPAETLRRVAVSLHTARSQGAGSVIRYRSIR